MPSTKWGGGPVLIKDEYDTWGRNRWDDDKAEWSAELGEKPRTCSYCGGAHPEDVISLIVQGWEIEPSTKSYKWYINTAGSLLRYTRLLQAIGNEQKEKEAFSVPALKCMPPVKLYGQHATREQLFKLNNLLDLQRGRAAGKVH